jgi:hypothetical protein
MKNITLEISLKPFKQTDDEYIENVCKVFFTQWAPLLESADTVSVMLWAADGSEILDYNGDMDESFEWAYLIGNANKPLDSPHGSIHERSCLYMENPPIMTYNILRSIIKTIKRIGMELTGGKQINVGATFDPGPEFAKSSFKYERHNEICLGNDMGHSTMVCCYGILNGDSHSYAAYPNGIPDKTKFGTFFGKQAQIFLSDMGYDYIWLSNGLGFGKETWSAEGAIFDGENFNAEVLNEVKDCVIEFWQLFTKECKFPIQVRGTNMSMGIDLATDGVPLKTIYDSVDGLLPPPNSPWAAINGNFGLELMGYMSRISYVPDKDYLIRYYLHDPWWMNSPWYDRYNGLPHDIYLPFAISRIDENGEVNAPTNLNLLTIDNSLGDMPDSCVYEPMPHLMKAIKELPDAVSPVVWVYPFDEYAAADSEYMLQSMNDEDWFIAGAINGGCPVSSVTTTDLFAMQDKSIYKSSVIITPVPYTEKFKSDITQFINGGGKVILYGDKSRCGEITGCRYAYEHNSVLNALRDFGISIEYAKYADERNPVIMCHRHDNAFIFSVYSPSTTVKTAIRFPYGAPVLDGYETVLENGCATYHFPKAEHRECRVFVEQNDGIVGCCEVAPVSTEFRRRINISGLKNATVRFLPEDYCKNNVSAVLNSRPDNFDAADEFESGYTTIDGIKFFEVKNVTGSLTISMPFTKNIYIGEMIK